MAMRRASTSAEAGAGRRNQAGATNKKDTILRRQLLLAAALAAALCAIGQGYALADGSGDPTAVKQEDGKWFDKNGNPTFHIDKDGTVDWYTFSGFRRYNSSCIVCHGPDGAGSTRYPGGCSVGEGPPWRASVPPRRFGA